MHAYVHTFMHTCYVENKQIKFGIRLLKLSSRSFSLPASYLNDENSITQDCNSTCCFELCETWSFAVREERLKDVSEQMTEGYNSA